MDQTLFFAGAALAAPMTYLVARYQLFRKQEVAQAVQDLRTHEAFEGASTDEVAEASERHMRSVVPLYGCLAVVGWAMVAAALR